MHSDQEDFSPLTEGVGSILVGSGQFSFLLHNTDFRAGRGKFPPDTLVSGSGGNQSELPTPKLLATASAQNTARGSQLNRPL